jgi:hypothetical protein
MQAAEHGVDFRDAARFWVKLGFIDFGWSSVIPFAVAVAGGAFVAMQRYRVGIVPVVAASGLAGLLVNGLL